MTRFVLFCSWTLVIAQTHALSQLQRHAFLRSTRITDQSLGGFVETIVLQVQLGQRGAEKPNRERENEELEGEKGIIRKRTAS